LVRSDDRRLPRVERRAAAACQPKVAGSLCSIVEVLVLAVTDRVRKVLWANSGNRCALCRRELVVLGEQDGHSIVGQECHIVSSRPAGPRFGEDVPGGDLDGYDNLMLLCGSDHTLVDQAVLEYPVERLCQMKAFHEAWWKATLSARTRAPVKVRRGAVPILLEVTDARDLLSIVVGAEESSLESEDPADEEEVSQVSSLLQNLHDCALIWDDLEPAGRIRATFDLGRELDAVRASGWRVFGALAHGTISGGDGPPSSWDTAYVRLARQASQSIMDLTSPPPAKPSDGD
jgi:hypothetical protein